MYVIRSGDSCPSLAPDHSTLNVGKKLRLLPILIDGWHRVAAMERLGWRQAEAIVVKASKKEARWLAAQANLQHGLPLKTKEIRAVFRAYVKAGQHKKSKSDYKSYREMQKDLNRPYTTIRNWMIKDFRHIAAKIGGDENFRGKGGLSDDRFDPFGVEAKAMLALDEALAAFQSTTDAMVRGQIIDRLDGLLKDMRQAGNWCEPDY